MKRVALAALVVCTAAGFAFGQAQNFSRYPAKVERAKAKAIDFRNSPGASTFRTRLRDGLRRGVNFAGHYVLVGWGCGTGCVSGAIIDARNGRVHFPKEFNAFGVAYTNDEYNEPLEYRKNSRLLILNGVPGTANDDDPEGESGTYFYEWRNDRFRLIRFVKASN
jgi:hypothetical protein